MAIAVDLAQVSEGPPQQHRSALELEDMEQEVVQGHPLHHAGALNPAMHPSMEDIQDLTPLEVLEDTAASWTGLMII
jgi:hypothetical protein